MELFTCKHFLAKENDRERERERDAKKGDKIEKNIYI